MNIKKLKDRLNRILEDEFLTHRVEVLIPIDEEWAYYRDNDHDLREWIFHTGCPEKFPDSFSQKICEWNWLPLTNKAGYGEREGCDRCNKIPSKDVINKAYFLRKLQKL